VQAEGSDLAMLELPTLLQLKDESWILLQRLFVDRWEIEDASGLRQGPQITERLSGTVLDRLITFPGKGSLWNRVGRLVLAHRRPLAQITMASVFLQVLAMATPLITWVVMDQALPQGSHSMLALAVVGVLLTSVASSGLGLVREWTSTFVEARLDFITRRGLLEHMLRLPFKHLMKRTTGELLQAFTGLSTAKDLISQHLFGTVMDALTATGYLVLMVAIWPLGTAMVISGSLLLLGLSGGSGLAQVRIQRKSIPAQILERDTVVQMIRGIATVKSAGVEGHVLERWSDRFIHLQNLGLQRQRAGLWGEVGMDSVRYLLTVVTLVIGGHQVLAGKMTIGILFAFQQMASTLTGTFQSAANLVVGFFSAQPQLEKAQEILSLEPEPSFPPPPACTALSLEMEDVWFRYHREAAWVLKGLDLKVDAGASHWLQWPSGAGKSTVLRLMAGLLEPERGQVRIGGKPLHNFPNQAIYIPQNFQIYGASILENLRILSSHAPVGRLMEAAESSGLGRLIGTMPMGYETLLAQGGSNLSGGQRQLILLTASMATERQTLLLDEAFANLDWLARSEIINGDWFKGKTVIYAGHEAGLTKVKTRLA
jgi:ABC-type bacteriocin/lantibiotic exporter with double-glycine peptidase domain